MLREQISTTAAQLQSLRSVRRYAGPGTPSEEGPTLVTCRCFMPTDLLTALAIRLSAGFTLDFTVLHPPSLLNTCDKLDTAFPQFVRLALHDLCDSVDS
jgi:hypothetical protein